MSFYNYLQGTEKLTSIYGETEDLSKTCWLVNPDQYPDDHSHLLNLIISTYMYLRLEIAFGQLQIKQDVEKSKKYKNVKSSDKDVFRIIELT